jgi:uncharacterized membrane protein
MKHKPSVIDILREDSQRKTEKRRQLAALAALGIVDFSIISLYQLGFIRRMPDLPGKLFDSNKVNSSTEAVIYGLPDGVISLSMYAATIFLATVGSTEKKFSRWTDRLLGGIVLGQAAGGTYYLFKMITVEKKVCVYCLTGALINFVAVKPTLDLLNEGQV